MTLTHYIIYIFFFNRLFQNLHTTHFECRLFTRPINSNGRNNYVPQEPIYSDYTVYHDYKTVYIIQCTRFQIYVTQLLFLWHAQRCVSITCIVLLRLHNSYKLSTRISDAVCNWILPNVKQTTTACELTEKLTTL